MRLEKIHDINSIFPTRKYKAEDACQRMIKNSIENWKKIALDKEYEKEYGLPYLKRHKGGRLDKIVFERKAVAIAKWQPLSPIKVTKILRQIKKMPIMVAMGDLAKRGSNRYAVAIYKVIKSCLANAYRKYASDDPKAPPLLPKFKELSATVGGYIKRPLFRARGFSEVQLSYTIHEYSTAPTR
ncbi:bifunctional Ribosomal protein L22-L17/Ribosomal protein L22-L17 superfamily [Babesia duncani]|uniref:Bifunctional Ribosomal protein L22-L17/Ribosomal protein L22-L17 superfamily n=1 Tax=Babesia duncani TaxID=323732 RepID=A0AAD9PIG7_9APIC|nr:bifunctional Ribosomal protein L22-L17/Ribosomal protein L22-L17 superfamily [Babesia duncani]